LAEQLLMRMAKDLEENAEIQQHPKREGRNMIMFLSPRKQAIGKPTTKPAPSQASSSPQASPSSQPAPVPAASSPTPAA
jgi:translation initiation factor IF-3